MPFCDDCDRLYEEEELDEEGACPRCGAVLAAQPPRHIPWTFKAMLLAFVGYLGYRVYQGITWVAHHV
ncbi:MAG: hypothetical protein ACRDVP_12195 [Acidimicrobiales bacterium]